MTTAQIKIVDKLAWLFSRKKRLKIAVGGRGSTKTTAAADYVLACMEAGQLWCCGREFQNSIDESVHRTMLDEIERIGFEGFSSDKTHIEHESGGRNFYRGIARNITSLKGLLSGIDGIWVEEGETLSDATIRLLSASVRLSAKDTERLIKGEDVKMPEILITMNRGSAADPVSMEYLKAAEPALRRYGKYEDDFMAIVEVNYTDMPREWFINSGLEVERLRDKDKMSDAQYRHKWHGEYLDEVEGSIIKPEWFDAAIDAHKKSKVFEPYGAVIAAYDPFDDGDDAASLGVRHGSIIKSLHNKDSGEIDECTDWATGLAVKAGADWFYWDGDGMGTGLKRQVSIAFRGKHTQFEMFKGSLRGKAMDNAEDKYAPGLGEHQESQHPREYQDTFLNNRSRYYIDLADRFHKTYLHIVKGKYIDPDEMISLNSEGIYDIDMVRSQVCRIPTKPNSSGLIQIMSKAEMKTKLQLPSPNDADVLMMLMKAPKTIDFTEPQSFEPDFEL